MSEEKKTCYGCEHRGTIPGDAYSKCNFSWENSGIEQPAGAEHEIKSGWWFFPHNFDPVWMKEECGAFSAK